MPLLSMSISKLNFAVKSVKPRKPLVILSINFTITLIVGLKRMSVLRKTRTSFSTQVSCSEKHFA
jgi:hypothetical protein